MTHRIAPVAVGLVLAVALGACGALSDGLEGEHFDDAGITAAIEGKFAADAAGGLNGVSVSCASRTVYLSGSVADQAAKQRAGDLARGVAGVRGVVNNVQVAVDTSNSDNGLPERGSHAG